MGSEASWKRTHHCGQLRSEDKNKDVVLMGWVADHRDLGGVIFIALRDRWGITQLVFDPQADKALSEVAGKLKMESVVAVRGRVILRPKEMVNPQMSTGEVEVAVRELKVLNESKTLPFVIKDVCEASDELRLKYRYLDLRRPSMQKNLLLRHRMYQVVRRYFDEEGFVEIETPFLMKSTPEGARDFLVPSRIQKGRFYALPQSPQTYKQLLMVSGYDRYFQIVRCFRDEDLRADRQPEFTQIDVEMSFVEEDDVLSVVERLMAQLFRDVLNQDLEIPFPRMGYDEAMAQYGTDAPDVRFGMQIVDVTNLVAESGFKVFSDTAAKGGRVRGIRWEAAGPLSRKQIDGLTQYTQTYGAKGLVSIQIKDDEIVSPVAKFIDPDVLDRVCRQFQARSGDALFLVADDEKVCCDALGNLRLKLASESGLRSKDTYSAVWIVDFPLLEWSEEAKRHVARHHPFTSPKDEDLAFLDSAPEKVRAKAYDLVLNGSEIAGGSIRNHRRPVQERMFQVLGMDQATANRKFGFLMDALECGAPPHGGIAFGFDRMVMLMAGEDSIREVIAFPKTTSALSLMDGSPSEVDDNQLKELGLRIDKRD